MRQLIEEYVPQAAVQRTAPMITEMKADDAPDDASGNAIMPAAAGFRPAIEAIPASSPAGQAQGSKP
jgi:hypothetical protein